MRGIREKSSNAKRQAWYGEQLAARLPARRLGEPDDVAQAAVFLASDEAGYITGETLFVTGGIGTLPLDVG